jgi:hypothetical protein
MTDLTLTSSTIASFPVRTAWLLPGSKAATGRRPTRHKIRPLVRGATGMARTRAWARHQEAPSHAGFYPAHPYGNGGHEFHVH